MVNYPCNQVNNMVIKFEFFEAESVRVLQTDLNRFMSEHRMKREDIIRIHNHSVAWGKDMLNKVMVVYEDGEPTAP